MGVWSGIRCLQSREGHSKEHFYNASFILYFSRLLYLDEQFSSLTSRHFMLLLGSCLFLGYRQCHLLPGNPVHTCLLFLHLYVLYVRINEDDEVDGQSADITSE